MELARRSAVFLRKPTLVALLTMCAVTPGRRPCHRDCSGRTKGSEKTISAGLEESNGRIVYEVTTVSKGVTTKFVVDPVSGLIK
jgi:hypothetical protein